MEAILTDSKPDEVTIDSMIKITNPKYGSNMLGDNDKKIYFVMAQDKDGYWGDIYIDMDLDYKITLQEKVTGNAKWYPRKTTDGWDVKSTSVNTIPLQLTISYKGSTAEIKKKMFFTYGPIIIPKKANLNLL